jgi:hypothetical protein
VAILGGKTDRYIKLGRKERCMQPSKEKLEIRGRLWLWSAALHECSAILKISQRNETELASARPSQKEKTFSDAFKQWRESPPGFNPGPLKLSEHMEFSRLQPKEYPAFTDCIQIRDYTHMLAIVLFCQMLNPGRHHEGSVAGNTKHFIQTHLEEILKSVFPAEPERERFEKFKEACLVARDKMIGHADGPAFDLQHGTPVSQMKMIVAAVAEIDFEYMAEILKPLSIAVMEHANRVTA